MRSIAQWNSEDGSYCFVFKTNTNRYTSRFWAELAHDADVCLAVRNTNRRRFYLQFIY